METKHKTCLAFCLLALLAAGCERENHAAGSVDASYKGVLRWDAHPRHTDAAKPVLVWSMLTDDGKTLLLEEDGHFLKAGAAPIGGEEYSAGDTVEFSGTLRNDRDTFGAEIQILSLPSPPNLNHLIHGTWEEQPSSYCYDVPTFGSNSIFSGGQVPFDIINGRYRVIEDSRLADGRKMLTVIDSLGCIYAEVQMWFDHSRQLVMNGHPGCILGQVHFYRYFTKIN